MKADPLEALLLDLLESIGDAPRRYAEVIASWRTSCPRLPVWEEANDRELIVRHEDAAREALVSLTPAGRALLAQHRARSRAAGGIG